MSRRTELHVHVGEPHVRAMNRTSTCMNRTSVSGEGRTGPKWSKKFFCKNFRNYSIVNRAVRAVQ